MTKYQIYYSATGLPKTEFPLPTHLVEHHFSCLPTDIDRHLSVKDIVSQVQIVSDRETQYAEVSLDDRGQKLDLRTMLADCIRTINMATPGLCFLIRIDNPDEPLTPATKS